MKQIWQCYTRSDWFYVLRKSQLTTQIENINAKDYDMGEENTHQWKESLIEAVRKSSILFSYFVVKICQSNNTSMFFEI